MLDLFDAIEHIKMITELTKTGQFTSKIRTFQVVEVRKQKDNMFHIFVIG